MKAPWRGRKVLVTAGPTREWLDPVRFLSNASSGKMGYALAAAARKRGARVTLVTGPTSLPLPAGVRAVNVVTAREMMSACLKALPGTDLVIGAAAVADFRPRTGARAKIKKKADGGDLLLRLTPNPDILRTLSLQREKKARPVFAGFALETHRLLERARKKMHDKGLDLIVANGPEALDGGETRAVILSRDGATTRFAGPKTALAEKILSAAEAFL
jgi:phosphopantothenoylcysteine decarboxylase / phosphopantothenate---cysteine ligase